MKNILILILLITCICCKNKHSQNISSYTGNLKHNRICQLDENPEHLGKIKSISFIDTCHFVITTNKPSNVFIYNTNGNQIKKIAKIGKGPNEIINPTIVRVYDKTIYVWCANLMKFVAFDLAGKPLKEYANFKKGLKDFVIFQNYICCFTGGGFSGSFISLFDMNKNIFIKQYGETSNEHNLLGILEGSGGLAVTKTRFIYSSPDKLAISSIDLNDWSESNYNYTDNEFVVKKVDTDGTKLFNSNPRSALDYICKNSVTTDIFSIEKGYILKTEVGEYSITKKSSDFSKRYDKLYFLDQNFKLISALKAAKQPKNGSHLYTSFGSHIYNISQHNENNMEFYYQLNRVSF